MLNKKESKMKKRKLFEDYQDDLDNHSDQLNPNNDAYWSSRGYGCDDDD
jgi:hypothetical protein